MKYLKADTLRLAATYLTIIMVMSIGFSIVLYQVSAGQLDRPRPRDRLGLLAERADIDDILSERAAEGKQELRVQLIILNIMTLLMGGLLSYLLAERTLKPIEENMQAQAQFVSDASHELRTPLAALMAANEVALRDKKLTLSGARQVLADNVSDVTRLQQLTTSLLDMLRDEQGEYHMDTVALQSVVADSMSIVAAGAVARQIAIDDQTDALFVRGNYDALVQLVTALLDNAVKYSPDHAAIQVTAVARGKSVTLSVRDQGMGIDEASLPHIFTRFYRADKARLHGENDGYGLGLAIAKRLVAMHHGKISAESQPGKGTTFRVVLPLVDAPRA